MPVVKVREMDVEFQLPNNKFIKQVPNHKYDKLIEHSDTKFVIRIINKQTGVPYCETFCVEEELIGLGLDKPNAQCCVFINTYTINWLKSTIMKKVITG